jgi:glutamine cyclotransferase
LYAAVPERLLPLLLLLLSPLSGATANTAPVHDYRVVAKLAQPRDNFVQGLEIRDGVLYVGTGGYGRSAIKRYRLADGELLDQRTIDPRLFGEGVTVLGDTVFQLTWRARLGAVYNREDLVQTGWFRLPGQGWGLCNNGRELIYSDGSEQLRVLAPDSLQTLRTLTVTENGRPLRRLNELEWIDGAIWANVWQSDRIVIIDPDSGHVTASVDLTGLLPGHERRAGTDVLNGIARDPADGGIWVTGKHWPWLYRIEIVPREAPVGDSNSDPHSR